MAKHTDGGPAFPVPGLQNDESFNGMTLRDYFAAKAMHALVEGFISAGEAVIESDDENLARRSYEIARAMLTIWELRI